MFESCFCCGLKLSNKYVCNKCGLEFIRSPNGQIQAICLKDNYRLIYIPEGQFIMGGVDSDSLAEEDEKPFHMHWLHSYFIGIFAVTNSQMAKFVQETGYKGDLDVNGFRKRFGDHLKHPTWIYPKGNENYPATELNYEEVCAYCRWAGHRLPTEAEWEKAARGTDARIYPWGNEWSENNCCNSVTKKQSGPVPVDTFPEGCSPYGCHNISGNVWEWCRDWYNPYTYDSFCEGDFQSPKVGIYRVLRGGSWCWADSEERRFFRCSYRNHASPIFPSYNSTDLSYGFRVARSCHRGATK